MSTLTKITTALALLLIGSLQLSAQNTNTTTIEGSGNVITKTLKTSPYNTINVRGSMEVSLIKGSEGTIEVTAEDNVQEHILVESDGSTLTISMKGNTSLHNTKTIKIKVPFEDLTEVSLVGSGKVEGNDLIKSDALALSLRGSGEIKLNADATSLDVQLNGSGDMELSGNVRDFEVKTTGSGDFEGKNLAAENTQVYVSGSGDARVNAKNSLKARVEGSGNINYGGNPTSNDSKVRGSGTIKPI